VRLAELEHKLATIMQSRDVFPGNCGRIAGRLVLFEFGE
jgi:hypothetical protein